MLLITLIAIGWLTLAVLVLSICRAAAAGDAVQRRDDRRIGRLGGPLVERAPGSTIR